MFLKMLSDEAVTVSFGKGFQLLHTLLLLSPACIRSFTVYTNLDDATSQSFTDSADLCYGIHDDSNYNSLAE